MWDWVEKAAELRGQGLPFVVATVVRVAGSTPREAGAKMLVLADGTFFGTVGGGGSELKALADAKACLAAGASKLVTYPLTPEADQLCGGEVEMFLELVNDRPEVYVFGAGHVGQAMAQTLADAPFAVHLVDERGEWVQSDRIPAGTRRHQTGWADFVAAARWSAEKTFVVIMTPSHRFDRQILTAVIRKPCRYLGMIGSGTKWQAMRGEMGKEGFTDAELDRVTCPIGLPIGGKSPREIAISVSAQLIAAFHDAGREALR
ncbi:MAG: xanthine dehydrogenase accessory protein XdhC [Elusimicrobia bacterium GWA2_69_24]|nr:MAG: xanthine dehydrogenase accessory protein XdhC [Elusimicrobia bacterium GWA2_69_24]HBL15425.1 xanthine dehydrogenase accessory protein XdhC [Elusimicrobiota bacterium]